jgi:hypothetical protein
MASAPITDPLVFIRALWPDVRLWSKEVEILESVRCNGETFVTAANKMGKDYTAGLLALCAFLRPRLFLLRPEDQPPPPVNGVTPSVKIITTSVKDDHLDDLWGEIDRFVRTCRLPLLAEKGGPLRYLHREIRMVRDGAEERDSYLKAEVAKKGEGRAGHHADYTLLIGDESSGLDDDVYTMAQGWAKRMLFIGNPNPCSTFFYRFVKAGDLLAT